jgi:hypothetical protein
VARRMQPPPERHVAGVSTGSFRPVHAPVSLAEHIVVVGFGITWGTVLASAIAFGLGATDLAKEVLERRMIRHPRIREMDDLNHW